MAKKPKTMSEIVDCIADLASLTKADAKVFIENMKKCITKQLNETGEFSLFGLGKLKLIDRPARMGRNPATGREIKIPAKKVIRFKPSKELKENVL